MGSHASPEIADITFHDMEMKIISKHRTKIDLWLRFRDDVFMIFDGTQRELNDFFTNINSMHPTFEFSIESSQQEITYLDLEIFKGQRHSETGILDMRTHTKLTDTFQFLHRQSCHPKATFNGFIKGEILRYIRTCNNKEDFTRKVKLFTEKLLARGYTETELSQITTQIQHTNRTSMLAQKKRGIK